MTDRQLVNDVEEMHTIEVALPPAIRVPEGARGIAQRPDKPSPIDFAAYVFRSCWCRCDFAPPDDPEQLEEFANLAATIQQMFDDEKIDELPRKVRLEFVDVDRSTQGTATDRRQASNCRKDLVQPPTSSGTCSGSTPASTSSRTPEITLRRSVIG